MSANLDDMTDAAMARHAEWVRRSGGQQGRRVRESFAEIMPVIPTPVVKREPGNIEFAGDEPEPEWYFEFIKYLLMIVSAAFVIISAVGFWHWYFGA